MSTKDSIIYGTAFLVIGLLFGLLAITALVLGGRALIWMGEKPIWQAGFMLVGLWIMSICWVREYFDER